MEIVEKPKSVKEILEDKELREHAIKSANHLRENVSKNWFTSFHCSQVLGQDLSISIKSLEALKLLGFVYERNNRKTNELEYKVILDQKSKLVLIDQDIDFYTKKVEILKKERERIKSTIE